MVDDSTPEQDDENAALPRGVEGKAEARQTWAQDSLATAESGDDKLVWPEFSNEADKDLKW